MIPHFVMADGEDAGVDLQQNNRFKTRSEEEKAKLLKGKDKENTQKATEGSLRLLRTCFLEKHFGSLEDIDDSRLPQILYDFYSEVKPKKGTDYAVQTLKCL